MSDKAWLVFEDGSAFPGRSVGAEGTVFGEAVFNTSMSGYQEIITDPSYRGQLVCMTYPHMGNYGVNSDDVESRQPWLSGFIMREMSPIDSNFRSEESLGDYLIRNSVVAIDGVDTRRITIKLREEGSMKCGLSTEEIEPVKLLEQVRTVPSIEGRDLVKEVTCKTPYTWPLEGSVSTLGPHVVVIDFGVKLNILRMLTSLGARVSVVPAATKSSDIMAMAPDGVMLSNGPGDPSAVLYGIETIKELVGQVPIFGICLGHQLLCLALGGKTFKLKFGHHGGNHPVKNLADSQVEITSQNHNFAVQMGSLPKAEVEVTHMNLNDNTIEGIRHTKEPVFGIQYHPEASPGPHDAAYLFNRFMDSMGALKT